MKRPSPALVISILALFVALGGTSYAITQLPKNSVGSPQLKKNAVTGAKVKDGSLTGTDVDVATLGTVPAASAANRANSAGSADRATTAGSAATATSADRATTAASATTAGSATTAASATTAGDAHTLDGKTTAELIAASKLQCPAEMRLAAGACIEEATAGSDSLYNAFQACGERNRRLPSKGELIAYVNQYVPTGSITAWIENEDPANVNSGAYVTASVVESTTYATEPFFSRAYRCATAASN